MVSTPWKWRRSISATFAASNNEIIKSRLGRLRLMGRKVAVGEEVVPPFVAEDGRVYIEGCCCCWEGVVVGMEQRELMAAIGSADGVSGRTTTRVGAVLDLEC